LKASPTPIVRWTIVILLAVMAAGAPGAAPAAAEAVKVAIVPFRLNAEKDMSFLRDGIYDMLASRIAWEGKVEVLDREVSDQAFAAVPEPIKAPQARAAGARIGADWVLYGSLTLFGNSVSIDTQMVDVTGAKETLSFFNQSEGMEEVIPRINLIAQDINARVFGRRTAVAGLPAQTAAQPQQARPSIYAHPESLVGGGDQNYSPFVIEGGAYSESPGFWKSRNIKTAVLSMSLGDVNGDKKTETVLCSSQEIFIFQNDRGRFVKLAEIGVTPIDNLLGVDTADINANGTDEIFVTAVNGNDFRVQSFVLEYNGSTYERIAEYQKWYLRVVEHPLRGRILLGQARGVDDIFFGNIHELDWSAGELVSTDSLIWTKGMTVFGFAIGDVTNQGVDSAIAYDSRDRLRIYTIGGKREWKSEDSYGGSETFILYSEDSAGRAYLAQRIFIADLNDSGKYEVVVTKNKSLTGQFFKNYRSYGGGQIVSLSWNGLGLAKNWHTRKVTGWFSDLAVGDIDNDGQAEIAATVVREGKTAVSKGKSAVVVYDLDSLAPAQ
jgi:TolB-like protein